MYREFLYIMLFPYTKSPNSSKSAPQCIGKSSISSSLPIPGFPRSKCGYRRKRHFLYFSPNLPRSTDFSAPNYLLQSLKSVFHFLLLQKTQTFRNTPDVHHMYSLCIFTFIFKSTELDRLLNLLQAQNSVF